MPADPALRDLVARVAAFHITDRALQRAQRAIEGRLQNGEPDERERQAYLAAVSRYFQGFEREARTHLSDVDRRLERVNQVQFNLTAERAVAVKRIESTAAVLTALRELPEVSP